MASFRASFHALLVVWRAVFLGCFPAAIAPKAPQVAAFPKLLSPSATVRGCTPMPRCCFLRRWHCRSPASLQTCDEDTIDGLSVTQCHRWQFTLDQREHLHGGDVRPCPPRHWTAVRATTFVFFLTPPRNWTTLHGESVTSSRLSIGCAYGGTCFTVQ